MVGETLPATTVYEIVTETAESSADAGQTYHVVTETPESQDAGQILKYQVVSDSQETETDTQEGEHTLQYEIVTEEEEEGETVVETEGEEVATVIEITETEEPMETE